MKVQHIELLDVTVHSAFSRYPAGRFRDDGQYSGEAFRQDHLVPKLKEALAAKSQVVVRLDGTLGYGSSFLEEAFGGLVRTGTFTFLELKRTLVLHSIDRSLINEIWAYIGDAEKRRP